MVDMSDVTRARVIPWCPQCGPEPTCDEDGCCGKCGADCGNVPDWRTLQVQVTDLEAANLNLRTLYDEHRTAKREAEQQLASALDDVHQLTAELATEKQRNEAYLRQLDQQGKPLRRKLHDQRTELNRMERALAGERKAHHFAAHQRDAAKMTLEEEESKNAGLELEHAANLAAYAKRCQQLIAESESLRAVAHEHLRLLDAIEWNRAHRGTTLTVDGYLKRASELGWTDPTGAKDSSPSPGVADAAVDSGAAKPREATDTVFAAPDNPGDGAGVDNEYGKPALLALAEKWLKEPRSYAALDCARELRAALAPGKNLPDSAFCQSGGCSVPARHHLCHHCLELIVERGAKISKPPGGSTRKDEQATPIRDDTPVFVPGVESGGADAREAPGGAGGSE